MAATNPNPEFGEHSGIFQEQDCHIEGFSSGTGWSESLKMRSLLCFCSVGFASESGGVVVRTEHENLWIRISREHTSGIPIGNFLTFNTEFVR